MQTVTDITVARQKRERLEAYHIAESVLDIYESVFPEDMRLRMTMPGAYDYATGLINESSSPSTATSHRPCWMTSACWLRSQTPKPPGFFIRLLWRPTVSP